MKLKVTIAQYDIAWENKARNLDKIESVVSSLTGKTDLVVLPEMCTTGFSMNVSALAETTDGETISRLTEYSRKYKLAICGSYISKDGDRFFNRGFFITPDDIYYYDKRHLFRMGDESRHYTEGQNKLIVNYKGFNIRLLICYDLRFPVWSRNVANEYDLLLYVANWPTSRIKVWDALLTARAIENMSYVCGVNRSGTDGLKIKYNGNSAILDAKGILLSSKQESEQIETIELSLEELNLFREKFPAWKDADSFRIDLE